MTETTDYFGIRIAPGENLADRFPQVAVRARIYKLEDDGASDLARRKRALRESIAHRKLMIADLQKRQAGESRLPPHDPEFAARVTAAHRNAIRELKEKLAAVGPDTNVLAPVARRVAREDRRRAKKNQPIIERHQS